MRLFEATLAGYVSVMLVVVGLAAPGLADHAQETSAGTVTFDHRGGNEWWVEAVVTHEGARPDRVQARDEGDATWHELDFKSWGEWGGSFHIEPGHRVMFRSIDNDQGSADSCWFTHPEGVEQCVSGDFEATFTTFGGNEWWVEVFVEANQPLAGVDARANEGAWIALEKKSWGSWAKSFHVPDGSVVEFRAHSTGVETVMSGQYRWPSGERIEELAAGFAPKGSNEWWVEALVIAESPVVSADARVQGGAWHALTFRDWGAWAASFHVPDGSTVEFCASAENGGTAMSDGFRWPAAVPAADPDGAWPQGGSYVRYDILDTSPAPSEARVSATSVRQDGQWLALCEGRETDPGGSHEFYEFTTANPPFGPTDAAVGGTVDFGALFICGESSLRSNVTGPDTYEARQEGDPVTIATLRAAHIDSSCHCLSFEGEWDQETGLVVFWDRSGRSTFRGELVDADSPLRTV